MKRIYSLALLGLIALPARGVEINLVSTNITIPVGTTFQMPLSASAPVTFKVDSISWRAVQGVIAPASNRSLVLNVTGVNSNNAPFTGDIVIQLAEDLVPVTTARIIDLVNSNFYDGVDFGRVVPTALCQATSTNTGVTLNDEYNQLLFYNGFGQLGMAKSSDIYGDIINDSGDSEFFITAGDLNVNDPSNPSPREFDFTYPLIGQVTRGFDVLSQLIGTAVDGQTPLETNVINTATITNDTQDAVLRLTCLPGFTGQVQVVVSARTANRETARQTINVNVIANLVNDPPFLGPIPSALVITQQMGASFILTTTDVENDAVNLQLIDTDTGAFPTNLEASLDSANRLWLLPDQDFTGTLNLQLGVTDGDHPYTPDTQQFALTVLPAPAAPTFTIVPRSGHLIVAAKPLGSSAKLSGTLAFTPDSDHTFGSNDTIIVTIGSANNPLTMTVLPNDPGRSTKGGVIQMKSIRGSIPTMAATFDSGKGQFKLALSNFNFPGPLTNPVVVAFTLGNDYGSNVTTWTESKPGQFTYPK